MGETDTLKKWINESNYIVFFGGAGVSTESNIPDFRSTDGLYHQEYDYPPETILSHSFYMRKPEEFYRFYRNKMLFPNAKPNRAHLALAKLEQEGKLKAVITQNIDGLHQAAGSKEVLELHGSVLRNHCTRCGRFYGLDDILKMKGVPKCGCGGVIKPDVVLYEEGLDNEVIERSIAHIRKAAQIPSYCRNRRIKHLTKLTNLHASVFVDLIKYNCLAFFGKHINHLHNVFFIIFGVL